MTEGVLGEVTESFPNALYRVQIGDKEIICYLAGKMKVHNIKVLVGDKVEVVLDPYGGKATNRIIRRK